MSVKSRTGLNLSIAGLCAAIGVIGLPLVVGAATPGPVATLVWLGLAFVASMAILVAVVPLSGSLGTAMVGLGLTRSQSALLAGLLAIGLALIVVQATLRPPLALLFGSTFDATIAALALTLVLALLVWTYETAQPMLKQLTRRTLDAAIPTIAARADEPTTRVSRVAEPTAPTARAEDASLTLPAAKPHDDATVRRSRADEPTIQARQRPAGA